MSTSATRRGDWTKPTNRPKPRPRTAIRKQPYDAVWIPLKDRSLMNQFQLLRRIENYVVSQRRWVSSKEIRKKFDLGGQQVRRYMEIIERLIPLQVERARERNEVRGTMLHYRVAQQ